MFRAFGRLLASVRYGHLFGEGGREYKVNPAKKAPRGKSARIPSRNPDFLVIGASRSGTTSLNHILGSHSQVYVPYNREIHFFDRNDRFSHDLNDYRKLMAGYCGERIVGDVTPNYWERLHRDKHNGGARIDPMARIAETLPNARLIITLRDPVERMRSAYMKLFLSGYLSDSLNSYLELEQHGASQTGFVDRSQYFLNIKHVLSLFPRENLSIIIFEEWTRNQERIIPELLSFIGADPSLAFLPASTNAWTRYRKETDSRSPDADLSDEMTSFFLEQTLESRLWIEDFLGQKLPWASEKSVRRIN